MKMKLQKYKLGELLDVKRGASLTGEYYATSGNYIRLTCGNFDYKNNSFKINTSKDDLYYTGPVRDEFIMKRGDIITPLTEQAIGLLGSTAIIPEDNKYIQSQDVAKIICKESVLHPMYAFYLISSETVKRQLSVAAQQTKIRHTSPDKIKDCVVWIPDLEEQKRIASILSALDNKIALNREINQNLEAMAKQLYDYWFVQFDFPNEEGKPYKSSGGVMTKDGRTNRLLPKNWNVKTISEIEGDIITGKTPSTSDEANFGGEIPFITIDDIRKAPFIYMTERTLTEKGANSQSNKFLPEGSLCCSCIGTTGIIGFVGKRGQTNQQINTIVFEDDMNKEFLYFSLNLYFQFAKAKTGNILPNMNKEEFSNILVVYPPNDILQRFHAIASALFSQMNNNVIELNSLTKQRDELLPLLMNGQVSIPNCD